MEADFLDCSYGYRPGRSAPQALAEIRGHLQAGYQAVYDADLKGYFDSMQGALFHGPGGPARWADAKLVRYADDFVVLAKQMGSQVIGYIESRLEGKFQLEINREKTRVVDLREPGASLNFLGYTFRYDRDLKGRPQRYLNVFPSNKAVQREREKRHEMTNSHQCFKPISTLIGELNRHRKGWANYFSFGYPTGVYWEIDWYVRSRLIRHLQRRSQRPYHPAKGEAWYWHLKRLGLVCLARPSESGTVHA